MHGESRGIWRVEGVEAAEGIASRLQVFQDWSEVGGGGVIGSATSP